MDQDNVIDGQRNRLSTLLPHLLSIIIQALLFFIAAAAITLFYLTYRSADFLQVFIVVGLILTIPWFIISLLPTLFGLKDGDLIKEIMEGQLLCMLVVLGVLVVLAVVIGFHPVLIDYAVSWIQNAWLYLKGIWYDLISVIDSGIAAFLIFFNEMIAPFLSR